VIDLISSLKNIGLTNNEAKIYYALLRLKDSKAGLISKKSGINRTTTYDSLNSLIEKGLVSYVVRSNNKIFRPCSPENFSSFLEEKILIAKKIIPELSSVYEKPEEKQNVTIFQGYKGIKSVFQDLIKTCGKNGTNLVLDSEGQFAERMPYYAPHFIKQLEDNNIIVKHIVRKGHDVKPSKTTSVRYIDKLEKSDASIDIYGNKLAVIVWTDNPEAVVIENKSLSSSMRFYFNLIWETLGKKD
jgi:sugar-specific transcriptional regulator TrmB